MKKLALSQTEKIAYGFLLIVFLIGIYLANSDIYLFDTVLTREDGFAEYGTALFLLYSSILLWFRLFKLFRFKSWSWKLGMAGIALVFLFGAGEEISWGQRLFNITSTEYFIENNAHRETNNHNMVVEGKKINKIVFSQLLTVVLVLYLLVLPLLYRKVEWINNLSDRFAVPVVKWHHTISFLICTALLLFMPSDRKWELYELAFSVIFFVIFLKPLNSAIYKVSDSEDA